MQHPVCSKGPSTMGLAGHVLPVSFGRAEPSCNLHGVAVGTLEVATLGCIGATTGGLDAQVAPPGDAGSADVCVP